MGGVHGGVGAGLHGGDEVNVRGSSKYRLPSKRVAELKNYCYQYQTWIEALEEIAELSAPVLDGMPRGTDTSDPVARLATARERFARNIRNVDQCIEGCTQDLSLRQAVRVAVTSPRVTFAWLKANGMVHYERDAYYIAVRRFYWLLDKVRD